MSALEPVPLVRCRLDGPAEGTAETLRYIPLAEFELWRHFMETRHRRRVTMEAVSVWLPEDPAVWNSGFSPDDLEAVLRVRLERPGPHGVPVPVERFFPAETYPVAQEKLLAHIPVEPGMRAVRATAGYFVPEPRRRAAAASFVHH
jgi:hypothetical protein